MIIEQVDLEMNFSKRKGVSPLIAAVLLIAFTMAIAAILTAWIASFTQEQRDKSQEFEKKISCAYSNIEIDDEYTKWDPANKIFYAFITNTGADPITLTKVSTWVDGNKQIPVALDSKNLNLTSIEKNEYIQIYVNISSGFSAGGSTLTKIEFDTECEKAVFDTTTMPQGGWKEFTWAGEQLANKI